MINFSNICKKIILQITKFCFANICEKMTKIKGMVKKICALKYQIQYPDANFITS